MAKTRHLLLGEHKRPYCLSLTPTAMALIQAAATRRDVSASHIVETLVRDFLQAPTRSDFETHNDEEND